MEENKTKKDNRGGQKEIKLLVFPDCEYIDLVWKNDLVIRLNEDQCKQLAGVTRGKAQELLYKFVYDEHGGRFPANKLYNYSLKDKNKKTIDRGRIRLIANKELLKILKSEDDMADKNFEEQLKELKKLIVEKAVAKDANTETLIKLTEMKTAAEINYYKIQLLEKTEKIVELKAEITDLNKQLDAYEATIAEAGQNSTVNKLLDVFQNFGKSKEPITADRLQDNPGIPAPLFELLNSIDWNKVNQGVFNQTMSDLNQYVTYKSLPRK